MAEAAVEVGSCSWLSDGGHEHADVPWLMDFDDASSAALGFVEILFLVYVTVTHNLNYKTKECAFT